jgi:phage-related protein
MDIAAATGKPLATVTTALEKAYGGNLTALAKLAPEYRQMIKDGASFDEVMAAMAVTTGGAATEAANTAEGQFKRLGVALNETKESIGAALMPVIEAALPLLMAFGTWAQNNTGILIGVGIAIASIAVAIMAVNVAMAILASPIILIVAGIVAVGAAIGIAYKKFEGFRNVVDAVFGAIKFGVTEVAIPYIKLLLTVFKTVFNAIGSIWNNTLGKIGFDIPNWVPGLGGKGFSFPQIPMLANGGIISQATLAVVGESGPEAVIPLDRMGDFGMGGGGINITVNAGLVSSPDQVGQQIIEAIQKAQRRSGPVFAPA